MALSRDGGARRRLCGVAGVLDLAGEPVLAFLAARADALMGTGARELSLAAEAGPLAAGCHGMGAGPGDLYGISSHGFTLLA